MTTATLKHLITTATALPGGSKEPSMLVSTPDVDRDGDRIFPEGMLASAFAKNSPLLWAHDYKSIPIGTVTHLRVISGKGIQAEWRWLDGDAFADRVKNAWEQGVIRAASIGFKPRMIEPNAFGGHDITAWELLEISLCPIPANPQATRTLKALGLLAESTSSSPSEDVLPYAPSDLDYSMDTLARTLASHLAKSITPITWQLLDDNEKEASDEMVNRLLGQTVRAAVIESVRDEVRKAICYHTGRVD